jgi:hypothetical protein
MVLCNSLVRHKIKGITYLCTWRGGVMTMEGEGGGRMKRLMVWSYRAW